MTPQSPPRAHCTHSPESSICTRYSAELEEIAKLDRVYYQNPSPTLAERAEYYERQEALEQIRLRLYTELGEIVRRISAKQKAPEGAD